jgi:S1-C subfamily serine protease
VVGVTTAILPDSQGIGFAVPINVVRDIAPQLVEKGRVVRAWLGVQGQFVPAQLKALLRLPLADGFLVEAIEPGSPAEQKGIQGGMFEITVDGEPVLLGGDIITAVNGGKLDAPEKLAAIMSDVRVGTALKLTVVREGKAQTFELSLGERPMQPWDLPARRTDTPGKTGSIRRAPAARRTFVF